jgi:rhodanese-related sulfurtransferase
LSSARVGGNLAAMQASRVILFLLITSVVLGTAVVGHAELPDRNRIEQVTGPKGLWNAAVGGFRVAPSRSDDFKEIATADYEKHRARGKAVALDALSPKEFAKGHVRDAASINGNDTYFGLKVARFDKSIAILVNYPATLRGAIASAEPAMIGFKTVCDFENGLDAWAKSGPQPPARPQP